MALPLVDLVHVGHWSADRLDVRWTPSTLARHPQVDALIEQTWAAASARPGVHLFDGPMCRLEWIRAGGAPGPLELGLSRSSYRVFLGTNLANRAIEERFGRSVMANPVGMSVALETADGHLVMGRRSARVAYYPSRVHPIAGALEPADVMPEGLERSDGAGIFSGIGRELDEELALTPAETTSMALIGVAQDRSIAQPELIFAARTRVGLGELASRVAGRGPEHTGLWHTPASTAAVEAALADRDAAALFTPVAVGTLLLWGRMTAGAAWLAEHAAPLAHLALPSRAG